MMVGEAVGYLGFQSYLQTTRERASQSSKARFLTYAG